MFDPQFNSARELKAHYSTIRQRLMRPGNVVYKPRPRRWSYAPAPLPVKPVSVLSLPPDLEKREIPTWKRIMMQVARKHGLTLADLTGPIRTKRFTTARHEAAYRMANELTMSLPAIGRRLGNRDHTTILNSLERHRKLLSASPARDVIRVGSSTCNPMEIIAQVALSAGVSVPQIVGQQKGFGICAARDEAMYQCLSETGLSLTAIGVVFGGRDHSTVRRAIDRHKARLEPAGLAA